jgi:flavin-dependent dehydrogenase
MTDPAVLHDCDVLIAGSGAAGLAAAVTAAELGLDAIVVEKSRLLGGQRQSPADGCGYPIPHKRSKPVSANRARPRWPIFTRFSVTVLTRP